MQRETQTPKNGSEKPKSPQRQPSPQHIQDKVANWIMFRPGIWASPTAVEQHCVNKGQAEAIWPFSSEGHPLFPPLDDKPLTSQAELSQGRRISIRSVQ